MRENFQLTTKIIIAALFVNWCEIALVNCGDGLEFWERDPSFDDTRRTDDDTRRANERHEDHKVRNIADKFRYNRGKTTDRSLDSVKLKHRAAYRSRDEIPKKNQIEEPKTVPGKVLRQGRERVGRWPKVQPFFKAKKQWNVLKDKREFPEVLTPYFISRQLKTIIDKFTNANVTYETIGRTVEYNDLVLLKITETQPEAKRFFRADEDKYIDEKPEKKIIFIVHGLSTMGMHMIPCLFHEKEFSILVSYYIAHLDKFDIFLVPIANPDGYGYSVSMWNKNMSPQTACPGVALDRNFDVAWNVSRAMSSCSQLFPGPYPFSEAESKAIRDVFHRYSHKIVAYFHVHAGSYSYNSFKGDAVLYPKGYTDVQTDDDKYLDLRGEVEEAMKNGSFQVLTVSVDTLHNWYGKVSGSSVDYASTVYGIPYALELIMQLYNNYDPTDENDVSYYALTEIWKRLIDAIFNNIWKNINNNEVQT